MSSKQNQLAIHGQFIRLFEATFNQFAIL